MDEHCRGVSEPELASTADQQAEPRSEERSDRTPSISRPEQEKRQTPRQLQRMIDAGRVDRVRSQRGAGQAEGGKKCGAAANYDAGDAAWPRRRGPVTVWRAASPLAGETGDKAGNLYNYCLAAPKQNRASWEQRRRRAHRYGRVGVAGQPVANARDRLQRRNEAGDDQGRNGEMSKDEGGGCRRRRRSTRCGERLGDERILTFRARRQNGRSDAGDICVCGGFADFITLPGKTICPAIVLRLN